MPSKRTVDKLEERVECLEASQERAAAIKESRRSHTERLFEYLNGIFDTEGLKMLEDSPEDEQRSMWPAWELWRILRRLDELKILTWALEGNSQMTMDDLEVWSKKVSELPEDSKTLAQFPIDCKMLHGFKCGLQYNQWGFAEFDVKKARQVNYIFWNNPTAEDLAEANRRMAEAGSLTPDPLPHFIESVAQLQAVP